VSVAISSDEWNQHSEWEYSR